MATVAVSLGSNLGDRRQHLTDARLALGRLGRVVAVSPVYRTVPVGVVEHPEYLNAVAVLATDLEPRQVMDLLMAIEEAAGRQRAETPLPRSIDLDLILYDDRVVDEDGLVVPHPRMAVRRFVLQPLLDVWPDAVLPDGTAIAGLMEGVADQGVTLADRGGPWVAAQASLAVLLIVALVWDSGSLALTGSWFQWLGRGLVLAGAVQAVLGVRHLGSQLTAFPEPINRGALVDRGIYGLVRHPLYGANVLLITGVALHQNSVWGLAIAAGSVAFYLMKALAEESRLVFRYPEYEDYRRRVRSRLIPFAF